MKAGVSYLLGIVTGIVLTIVVSVLLVRVGNSVGVSYYDEPGDPLSFRTVTVFQALSPGMGLVQESGNMDFNDQIYLLQMEGKRVLYDGENVRVPTGKVFRIVGTYSYDTPGGMSRTVPVIAILDRK